MSRTQMRSTAGQRSRWQDYEAEIAILQPRSAMTKKKEKRDEENIKGKNENNYALILNMLLIFSGFKLCDLPSIDQLIDL